jgi:Na+-transporting NADH:ubiquinone oxidoreductase subunit A
MKTMKINKGMNLPISGKPEQHVYETVSPQRISLIGYDFVGLKPTMKVSIGDYVKKGQLLFQDKKMPDVNYTSPGTGKVVSINRGPKRAFESLIIHLEGDDEITFKSFNNNQLEFLDRETVKSTLLESGLWVSLRQRPFSKVANPKDSPHSIFVTAMDTHPLAPSMQKVLEGNENNFNQGLLLISKLTDGTVYLNKSPELAIPETTPSSVVIAEFTGPHPAGNVGTHIHYIDPVSREKTVWHINLQDVISIGKLFFTGKINTDRIISIAGPSVKKPRLIKTRIGASTDEITHNHLKEGENRIVSGSVLSGRTAHGVLGFLGRYHQQISVLQEDRKRTFLGWLNPGFNQFSIKNVVLSKLLFKKEFDFSTSLMGSQRAIVPIGSYEKVMPLDILPTFLFRSLIVDDIEEAEKLGCLELDEEDLALCTFVCPSKIDYGPILRRNLTLIEKEA